MSLLVPVLIGSAVLVMLVLAFRPARSSHGGAPDSASVDAGNSSSWMSSHDSGYDSHCNYSSDSASDGSGCDGGSSGGD